MDSMVTESRERVARTAFEMQSKLFSNELERVKTYHYGIRAVRHSLDHHVQTLNDLLNNGEYDRAKAYAQGLTKVIDANISPIVTNIPELNSISKPEVWPSATDGYQNKQHCKSGRRMLYCTTGLYQHHRQLMDNAIEAAEPVEDDEKRKIDVSVGIVKGTFFIEIMNPYIDEPIKDGEKYISTK